MGHAVGLVELSIVGKVKHGNFAFHFLAVVICVLNKSCDTNYLSA